MVVSVIGQPCKKKKLWSHSLHWCLFTGWCTGRCCIQECHYIENCTTRSKECIKKNYCIVSNDWPTFITQAHAMRLCSVSLKFFNFFLSTTLSNVSTKCLNQFWWNLDQARRCPMTFDPVKGHSRSFKVKNQYFLQNASSPPGFMVCSQYSYTW